MQLEHLAARGTARIGYALPADPRLTPFATARVTGVRSASLDLGLGHPDVQIVGLDPAQAARAVSQWRSGADPITAICASNDEVALAVLAGMRAHQLQAPHDLAVVGVDNLPVAALRDPLAGIIGDRWPSHELRSTTLWRERFAKGRRLRCCARRLHNGDAANAWHPGAAPTRVATHDPARV